MAQRIVDGEQFESVLIRGGHDGADLAIRSNGGESVAVFIRPNDATPYSANDAVSPSGASYVTFSGLLDSGQDVYITNASLLIREVSVPAGMGSFRLHLFNAVPSGTADNAAFAMPSGDVDKYKGFVEIATPVRVGGVYIYRRNDTVNTQVALASGDSSLYGVLETLNGWTPASGCEFRVSLSYFPA